MPAVEVEVLPPRRAVHLGQDAAFTCHARHVDPGVVQYHWQVPAGILDSGRVEDSDGRLTILDTAAADNNTDVTCLVLGRDGLQGSGVASLVVLPALPSTERPTTTQSPEITTGKLTTVKPTTLPAATSPPTTLAATRLPATSEGSVSVAGTSAPSKMPSGPHQGPTQSAAGGLSVGTLAPAVAGGFLLLAFLLVAGAFLARRHRRRSKQADAEKAGHSEAHVYEFVAPRSMDFQDGGNSDEENHNSKRHGNNSANRDSLRTYSRGTAPDSVGRYARAVPRKDRIVLGGSHGAKARREPVVTLSLSSLYEETTPTFVVANPENGTVDVRPYKTKGEAVEIVGSLVRGTGLAHSDDEDQYVTLARNPPQPHQQPQLIR